MSFLRARSRSLPNLLTLLEQTLGVALVLWGVAALLGLLLVPARFLPAEDAVILYSYSQNVVHTGVVSFIPGGPRAEGATDFGSMLLLALGLRCGVEPFLFSCVLSALSLLALSAVLLRLARARLTGANLLSVAGAAALSRQIFAAASGFAVPPDAFLLALLVLCVERRRSWAAALVALALCLLRPDGVLFAVPLLLLLVAQASSRTAAARAVLAAFVFPGCAYFLARWLYFGEFLPLPFVVKETFRRDFLLFIGYSVRESLSWLLFAALVLVPVLRGRWRRSMPLLFALLILPTLFYWTVRMDQNVAGRFFFFIPLAVGLLLATYWSEPDFPRLRAKRLLWASWAVFLALPLYRESLTFRDMQFQTAKEIASSLQRLPRHGTLLVTEAGFVPFYSQWPTTDAWGLNTPKFAHHFVQPADVERLAPDLLVVHPDLGDGCVPRRDWPASYPDREFPHMVRNLVQGAQAEYELWLTPYGSAFYQRRKGWNAGKGDRECWFVRRASPLRGELEQVMREHSAVPPEQAVALESARGSR